MADIKVATGGGLYMAGRDFAAAHTNGDADGAVRTDFFLKQGRVDAILQGNQGAVFLEMRHRSRQGIGSVIRTHGDEAAIELSLDFSRENNFDFYVEWTVRHIHLQPFFANGSDMFPIDIDECQIMSRPCQPAANNPSNGSCANDHHFHSQRSSCVDEQVAPTYLKAKSRSTRRDGLPRPYLKNTCS